ncbi:MAG: 5'/3'-nucleotidase SurE [Candidatus Hydrogenedentes bacterium]|nr:5'/3'-nucleotidase SurE [Candidatus Hydrogenedentota bacterium]
MPIVITNDDGIDAAGLRALAGAVEAACGAEVYIVAPDRGYSGCSQQVTMHAPIPVTERGPREFAIGGTPADCARLAITTLAPNCRLILSGINHGGNMGHDILLSGTVGAAREAACLGVSAVAFSQYLRGGREVDWPRTARWAVAVLGTLPLDNSGPAQLWNVNFPFRDGADGALPPVARCEPCPRPLPVAYAFSEGACTYDGSRYHERAQEEGTDVSACFGGSIAVSRLPVAVFRESGR